MTSRINYSVSLQASLAVAGQGITAGQLVITNGTAWLLATAANLAANPGAQLCVALDTSPAGGPFRALWIGAVPDDVARLGAGAASFVGNDGSANMQRQSSASGAVGYCDVTGLITFLGAFLASQIGATGITSLTGGATATGPGAAATTLVLTASAFVTGVLAIANGGIGLSSVGANNTVLTSNGTTASWQAPASAGITALTGDVTASGSGSVAATVAAIQGVVISGTAAANKTLVASGSTAAAWGTLPAAGVTPGTAAQIFVTNAGATAPAWVSVSGDASITAAGAVTVARVNGATVPAAGALTAGNAAYVSGSSALTYSALNLAGGSGWVTGVLPSANQAAQTMGGDVTGTTAASVVSAISGSSPIAITPNALQWVVGATPLLAQADVTTNSATGALSTHRAQNATGTTSVGGAIRLTSGTGTTRNGDVQLYSGATQRARIFEAQQHHFQLGDGGGDATALYSNYTGFVVNDSTFGTCALVTDTTYTFFAVTAGKTFLLNFSSNLSLTASQMVPMVVDPLGQTLFQRGGISAAGYSNVTLAAVADAAGTTPLVTRGFSGQTANLFTAQISGPTTAFEITATGNVGIGAAGSYGGGLGGTVFLANASTAPTSTPTGGGVLYAQAGALKYRGSSGTVTTLAPA